MDQTAKKRAGFLLLLGGGFFLAAFALLWAARKISGFANWYANTVYPVLVGTIGRFFGIFPFSASELGLYAGIVCFVVFLYRNRKAPFIVLSGLFCTAAILLFSYAAGCGVNYYRRPFSSYMKWSQGTFEKEDLEELCRWLTDQVNLSYIEAEKEPKRYAGMSEKGVRAMEKLSVKYPQLSGYYPKPKPVLASWILSVQQYSGIYSPFTMEANYNHDMVGYNIPHTICHEMSHLRGFMREDEANFIGYLACLESESADWRYSGYLLGWIYSGNALAKENFSEYMRLYEKLSEGVKKDLQENSEFWDQYEGKAAKAANKINDTYLKANGQAEGVKTYGRVVDLMILDFLENRADNACIADGKMVEWR